MILLKEKKLCDYDNTSIIFVELPAHTERQNELQPGVRDSAVPGLYLWQHNWRPGSARTLHQ